MKYCCEQFKKEIEMNNLGDFTLNEGLIGIIDEKKNIRGAPFNYCPWCGKNLAELKLE